MDSPRKRARKENTLSAKASVYYDPLGEKQVDGVAKIFYKCKLCSSEINGHKQYNLVHHLHCKHPDEYKEIDGRPTEDIQTKRLKMLQNLVEIVTVNGRVFASILDSGFQALIWEKLDELKNAGCGLNLSNENLPEVKQHLSEMAKGVRQKINDEVRGRALALLVDIGTKNHRSILSISIQYIMNGKVKVRGIGMIELLQSHTGVYLAELICALLIVYGIDLRQILTITTDNGANVLKMVRDIDVVLQHAIDTQPPQVINAENDNANCDVEIEELLNEMTDDDALDLMFNDADSDEQQDFGNLLTEMSNRMDFDQMWNITGVNCSAHTLQLAVKVIE